jgi:DNA-binding Lrp family transcriptional regulator
MRNKTKLDRVDVKIISALLNDSRTSFTDLAEACKISVNAVSVRFGRLKKAGIINGETIEVNPYVLGYRCIADICVVTAIADEEKVRAVVKKEKQILMTEKLGNYNISALGAFHSTTELTEFVQRIEADPGVKRTEVFIWPYLGNAIYPENLFATSAADSLVQNSPVSLVSECSSAELDEIDREIIRALAHQSRMPFNQLAKTLGVSTNMIIRRYAQLRALNIITRSHVTLNFKKLGYNAFAVFFLKTIKKSDIAKVYNQIVRLPNVVDVVKYIGIYDMRVSLPLVDLDAVFSLNEQIEKIEGIDKVELSLHKLPEAWPFTVFPALV